MQQRRKSAFDGVVTEETPNERSDTNPPPPTPKWREPVTPAKPPLPFDHPLLQNSLPGFQSTLSPPGTISWLLLCALFGIIVGAMIVNESDAIFEQRVAYGSIRRYKYPRTEAEANASQANGGVAFADEFGGVQYQGARTEVVFEIDRRVEPPITLSYTIKGMIMSYRQFANSRSSIQLQGDSLGVEDLVKCRPLRSPGELGDDESTVARQTVTIGDSSRLYGDMVYFPCGAVPWSMFNDSITLFKTDVGASDRLICNASDFGVHGERMTLSAAQNPCTKNGIAWPSDRNRRFLPTASQFDRIDYWSGRGRANTSDIFLQNGWYHREPGHKVPDPEDEDLMVWMRIPGLSDFRQTLRIIHTPLEPGTYRLVVGEFFDTASFAHGDKGIELRSRSWLGGQNYTLGGIMIGGGSIALILAVVFFVRASLKGDIAVEEADTDDVDLPPAQA